MNANVMTAHAMVRAQQRGIPNDVIDWVLRYGRERHDHRGASVYFFDKRARRKLGAEVGGSAARICNECGDVYAVVNRFGAIVTVGHRTKRLPAA
jgi:hypothetical protein